MRGVEKNHQTREEQQSTRNKPLPGRAKRPRSEEGRSSLLEVDIAFAECGPLDLGRKRLILRLFRHRPFAQECHGEERAPPARRTPRWPEIRNSARHRGRSRNRPLCPTFSNTTRSAMMMPASEPPAIRPVDIMVPGLVSDSSARELADPVDQRADQAADEDRHRRRERQVDAHRERQGRDPRKLHHDGQHRAQDDQPPGQVCPS